MKSFLYQNNIACWQELRCCLDKYVSNTRCSSCAGPMMAHRRRRWAIISPAQAQFCLGIVWSISIIVTIMIASGTLLATRHGGNIIHVWIMFGWKTSHIVPVECQAGGVFIKSTWSEKFNKGASPSNYTRRHETRKISSRAAQLNNYHNCVSSMLLLELCIVNDY